MAEQIAEPQIDESLYDLSDEDFLKQFNEAKAAAKTDDDDPEGGAAPAGDQPRDDKGRFVKKDEAEPAGDEPATVYRYEIDLGDGGGKQVFEGETYEDLIEKLGKAQEHATRKIRELSAQKKADPTPTAPVVNEEEEFVLSQELMVNPTKAVEKVFEKLVGKPLSAFKNDMQRLEAFERAQRETENAKSFVQSHPEYVADKHNGNLMENYLRTFNMEGSPENIEKAFTALSERGLLKLKTDNTQDPEETPTTPTTQRIAGAPAASRTVIVQKRAASGLSAKRSVSAPTELTEDDLYNMPMTEFEKLGGMSRADNW